MADEFFRAQTEAEKRDFTSIMGKKQETRWEKYRKQIIAERQKLFEQKIPFCFKCARADYKDKVDEAAKSMERKKGYINFSEINITPPELGQYSKTDRFEVVKEQKAMEKSPSFVAGRTVHHNVQIGVHRDYKCKVCEKIISMYLSFDDLEKENAPKKGK